MAPKVQAWGTVGALILFIYDLCEWLEVGKGQSCVGRFNITLAVLNIEDITKEKDIPTTFHLLSGWPPPTTPSYWWEIQQRKLWYYCWNWTENYTYEHPTGWHLWLGLSLSLSLSLCARVCECNLEYRFSVLVHGCVCWRTSWCVHACVWLKHAYSLDNLLAFTITRLKCSLLLIELVNCAICSQFCLVPWMHFHLILYSSQETLPVSSHHSFVKFLCLRIVWFMMTKGEIVEGYQSLNHVNLFQFKILCSYLHDILMAWTCGPGRFNYYFSWNVPSTFQNFMSIILLLVKWFQSNLKKIWWPNSAGNGREDRPIMIAI